MDGEVLTQWLTKDALGQKDLHPERTVTSDDISTNATPDWSAEDEETIMQQLRNLGYVD
jgi:hypothetical protein